MLKTIKKNWQLLALVFLLIAIGMVFIYSASSYSSSVRYDDSFYFVKKQLLGFVMGLVVMAFFMLFDYHKFVKLRWIVVAVYVGLLLLVFIPGIGRSNYGANRWITIGGISLQSSEVAKFGFVIFSASYLSKNYKKMDNFWHTLPIIAVGGCTCLLILLEPNLSVTLCLGTVSNVNYVAYRWNEVKTLFNYSYSGFMFSPNSYINRTISTSKISRIY